MRNLRFAHDWDFMLRATAAGGCSEVAEPLMDYRVHGANTITSNRRWMLFEVVWVAGPRTCTASTVLRSFPPARRRRWPKRCASSPVRSTCRGSDKLFWVLLSYLSARRAQGAPETELLDDPRLRQAFIDLIPEA